MSRPSKLKLLNRAISLITLSTLASVAQADEENQKFDITAQPLTNALEQFSRQTNIVVLGSGNITTGKVSDGLYGEHSPLEALTVMLSSSGLSFVVQDDNTIVLQQESDQGSSSDENNSDAEDAEEVEEITVIGTRLKTKNANTASPTKVFDREELERGGYNTLEDVFRRLPSNLSSITPSNVDGRNPREGDGPLEAASTNTLPLSALGASSVNLRGIGSRSTLILVNGRRQARSGSSNGGFVDISSIPLSQVERVEILLDGASAIYGSDAVAGVVDIILRDDYVGGELSVRHEDSSSGADNTRVTGSYGFNWDSGRLTATVDISERKSADTNSFIHSGPTGPGDFTDLNGTNQRNLDFNPTNPTVFPATDFFGFFVGFDGSAPLQQGAGGSIFQRPNIGPATEQQTVRFVGEQELGEGHLLDFEASYSKQEDGRTYSPQLGDLAASFSRFTVFDQSAAAFERVDDDQLATFIRATNPNNPFGADVLAFYSWERELALLGPVLSEQNEQDDASLSLGLSGDLPLLEGWDYELDYSYNQSDGSGQPINFSAVNPFSAAELQEAANNVLDNVNIFTDDVNDVIANAELLETLLRRDISFNYDSNVHSLEGVIRTSSLFSLPAGEVAAVVGFQYRTEDIFREFISLFETTTPTDSTYDVTSAFAEFNVPLLSNLPLIQKMDINLSARYEETDSSGDSLLNIQVNSAASFDGTTGAVDVFTLPGVDFESISGFALPTGVVNTADETPFNFLTPVTDIGRTFSFVSPSVRLRWEVTDDLVLRSTWGESFSAPTPGTQFGTVTLDSEDNTIANNPDLILPERFTEGGQITRVLSVGGANPNLEGEEATTLTYGFDYNPGWVPGLELGATYSRISYNNFIGLLTFGNPEFISRFNNDVPGTFVETNGEAVSGADSGVDNILLVDSRLRNFARRTSEAVDINVSYTLDTDIGSWRAAFNGTRNLETSSQLLETSEPFVFSDSEVGPSNWRGNLELSWTGEQFSVTSFINYDDDARVIFPFRAFEEPFGPENGIPFQTNSGSYTTVDVQLDYTSDSEGWLEGTRFSLGVQNLFEPDFPFVDTRIGYNTSKVNTRGRTAFLNISKVIWSVSNTLTYSNQVGDRRHFDSYPPFYCFTHRRYETVVSNSTP